MIAWQWRWWWERGSQAGFLADRTGGCRSGGAPPPHAPARTGARSRGRRRVVAAWWCQYSPGPVAQASASAFPRTSSAFELSPSPSLGEPGIYDKLVAIRVPEVPLAPPRLLPFSSHPLPTIPTPQAPNGHALRRPRARSRHGRPHGPRAEEHTQEGRGARAGVHRRGAQPQTRERGPWRAGVIDCRGSSNVGWGCEGADEGGEVFAVDF